MSPFVRKSKTLDKSSTRRTSSFRRTSCQAWRRLCNVSSRVVGKQAHQQGLNITTPISTPHGPEVEVAESVISMEQSVGFGIKHTFINIVVKSSLCSVPIGRAVQSA